MKTISTLLILIVAFVAAMLLTAERRRPPEFELRFTGLGDLPGGMFHSVAKSLSADGAVVVGCGHSREGVEAFCWTQAEGMTGLGFQHALDTSADGATIVGYRVAHGRGEPIRWSRGYGIESLTPKSAFANGAAHGISANGSTIVGVIGTDDFYLGRQDVAFAWSAAGGLEQMISDESAKVHSEAHAVSDDGKVVVGASRLQTGHNEAFRWSRETGRLGLGFLPGHSTSIALATSADGSVVVGRSSDFITTQAFRWTRETGMVCLASPSGLEGDSAAHGVSADGSIIVGYRRGGNGQEAFVWDASHGMRSLRDVLAKDSRLRRSLQGWQLLVATAASSDGSVIIGYGRNRRGNQEAWIARLSAGLSAN